MRHVAGSWKFEPYGLTVDAPRGRICTIDSCVPYRADMKENGVLIAAAPDLLQALELLTNASIEQTLKLGSSSEAFLIAIKIATDAMDKAKGLKG